MFFVCGYAIASYKNLVKRALAIWGGVGMLLLLVVVALRGVLPLPQLAVDMACLGVVVYIIKRLYMDESDVKMVSSIKRGLTFLGKNTLEIYFLHYFLLFPMPDVVGRYFMEISMTSKSHGFPELLLVGAVVVIICISCIVLSACLKKIPYISLIAFGKIKQNAA